MVFLIIDKQIAIKNVGLVEKVKRVESSPLLCRAPSLWSVVRYFGQRFVDSRIMPIFARLYRRIL